MSSLSKNITTLPDFEPGWVWLVGAGPGDPGLLTVAALHALESCDVVVYDALVDPRILRLVGTGVRLEYAGKRGGKPSPIQPDISNILVRRARSGWRVLRLKGGDPFTFGRGGEEGLALVRARVPFRVIPGITAGIGGLAYAGIPVTHRETNSAVTFVTGNSSGGGLPPDLDWRSLAQGSPMLVFYMALNHLDQIADHLRSHGRSEQEPVAIVSRATWQDQHVLETTLGHCAEAARAAQIKAPAIIAIGEAVRLRAGLDWLSASCGAVLDPDPIGLANQWTHGKAS